MYLSGEPDRMNHIRPFFCAKVRRIYSGTSFLKRMKAVRGAKAGADAEPLLLDGDNEKSRETKQ